MPATNIKFNLKNPDIMPLFFNKMQRRNPQDPEGERKWYVVLRSTGVADEQEMAKLLSEETTLNPKEAEMAIYQLFKVVVRQLLNSKTVPLGSIGTLRLTVSSEGADTEKEANANLIKTDFFEARSTAYAKSSALEDDL